MRNTASLLGYTSSGQLDTFDEATLLAMELLSVVAWTKLGKQSQCRSRVRRISARYSLGLIESDR